VESLVQLFSCFLVASNCEKPAQPNPTHPPKPPSRQVHRATLRTPDGALLPVAVKVRHPRVAERIALDFKLLALLADAAGRVPALRGLSLRQSVAQFTATMTAQCDLRIEAVHALRFANNFKGALRLRAVGFRGRGGGYCVGWFWKDRFLFLFGLWIGSLLWLWVEFFWGLQMQMKCKCEFEYQLDCKLIIMISRSLSNPNRSLHAAVRSHIAVPRPVAGLVSPGVYVMEWMGGDSVAAYMRNPTPANTEVRLFEGCVFSVLGGDGGVGGEGGALTDTMNARSSPDAACGAASISFLTTPNAHSINLNANFDTLLPTVQVVALGVDCYMKMLLTDNFIHTDLHPGNIMVAVAAEAAVQRGSSDAGGGDRPAAAGGGPHGTAAATQLEALADPQRQLLLGGGDPASSSGGNAVVTGGNASASPRQRAQLILLDFGLAQRLTPDVRYRFISFLNRIVSGGFALACPGFVGRVIVSGLCSPPQQYNMPHTQHCPPPASSKPHPPTPTPQTNAPNTQATRSQLPATSSSGRATRPAWTPWPSPATCSGCSASTPTCIQRGASTWTRCCRGCCSWRASTKYRSTRAMRRW